MKTLLCLLLFCCVAAAQDARPLPSARGYYKTLAALSQEPSAERAEWDKLRFPIDQKRWEAFQKPDNRTYYLPENPDLIKVAPPPANSSAQTLAELEFLYQMQLSRTHEDIRRSFYLAGVLYMTALPETDSRYKLMQNNLFHIGRGVGTWFNPEKLPKTRLLMSRVRKDADYFIAYHKLKYARIRPYRLDARLKNLEETNWEAYPSGHGAHAYVAAFVYQELAPEFADIFTAHAAETAQSREILGVHYPSDSESARIMARDLVNRLLQNPKFQTELAEAKTEWKAAHSNNY